jgi:hypothetical protein
VVSEVSVHGCLAPLLWVWGEADHRGDRGREAIMEAAHLRKRKRQRRERERERERLRERLRIKHIFTGHNTHTHTRVTYLLKLSSTS